MEASNANKIPIKDILEHYDCHPAKLYGHYDMYCSPLREDPTPSFQVILENNTWKDHGSGEFGSAVDLVMKIEKCGFLEAMHIFEGNKFNSDSVNHEQKTVSTEGRVSPMEILKVAPLQNKILIDYMQNERGICPEISTKYCKEVYFRYTPEGKTNFAVAFENDKGGIEFRNKYSKGCAINKDITSIKNSSERCLVFEGFIDFLSYMQIMKDQPDKQNFDVVILNSVSQIGKASEFIKSHKCLNCFLDNDSSGQKAFNAIASKVKLCTNESIRLYPKQKDLNEYWVGKLRESQLKKKDITDVIPPPIKKANIKQSI